jgi:hypothetical protein
MLDGLSFLERLFARCKNGSDITEQLFCVIPDASKRLRSGDGTINPFFELPQFRPYVFDARDFRVVLEKNYRPVR